MAELINLAGTTSHSFTIGGSDGITKYFGNCVPTNDIGKVGDLYIQVKTPVEGFDSVADLSALNNYDTTNLYNGFYIEVITDSNHNNHSTIYVWKVENNSSGWDFVYDEDAVEVEPLRDYGKLYIKTVNKGVTEWFLNEKIEYDTPIIKTDEIEPGVKKVNLQSATNANSVISSTKGDDYKKNHDNFGVTRYGTNDEVVASDITNYQTYSSSNLPTNFNTSGQKFMDKYIALTPKQVADNIKVEMKRAITVEGKLDDLNSPEFDSYKTDLVTAINHENTRAKTVEGNLTSLNFYNDASWTGTKNLVTAINFENTRATTVEGNLTNLRTDVNTNLVAAINSELDARTYSDNDLQRQIDAITSKSDVVDVVQCYDRGSDTTKTDIVHYDTSTLGDDDIIKVLDDETHDDTVAYWRFNRVPEEAIITVATKAALDAYDTTYLEADDVAIVTSDSSHSNQKTYYKLTVSGSTKTWTYQGVVSESWSYVGSVEAYYTIAQSDSLFVHKTAGAYQDETIVGNKTFSSNILRTGAFSGTENVVIKDTDTNNKGSIESDALYTSSKIYNRTKATNTTANKNGYLDVAVSDTGVGTLGVGGTVTSWSNNTASNSTSSNDVALIGWVNDPTKSTNVVHRTGNETIAGTKTFNTTPVVGTLTAGTSNTSAASTAFVGTAIANEDALVVHLTGDESIAGTKTFTGTIAATSATVNVATQTRGDSSNKAASTAFVADGLSLKVNIANMPAISSGTAGQVIACPESGNNYVWKTVRDITTIGGLDDTAVENEEDDQSLVYNGSTEKWCNKRPTVAVISYW